MYPDLKKEFQVLYQIGQNNKTNYKEFYQKNNIESLELKFFKKIELCYQAADIIICRAGAGTLFEASFFNKSCIIFPLQTSTTSHQKNNAIEFTKNNPNMTFILESQDVNSTIEKIFKLIKIYQQYNSFYLPNTTVFPKSQIDGWLPANDKLLVAVFLWINGFLREFIIELKTNFP